MSTASIIPGITQGALDAVQDENARRVLQEIVSGWQTRNGMTGKQENKFLTEGEIANMMTTGRLGQIIKRTASSEVSKLAGDMGIDLSDLGRLMADVHNQVFESQLFKALAERVDLIDKPGGLFERMNHAESVLVDEAKQRIDGDIALSASIQAMGIRIGSAETAITEEKLQRVNADNAIQQTITTQYAAVNQSMSLLQTQQTTTANSVAAYGQAITTLQAQVAGVSASVQQEAQVRAAADSTLYAQWVLKVEAGGVIAGIGLANNGERSNFIVRADTFSIISPHGNYAALIMQNNTIHVFDEVGRIRVRIGRLV